MITNEIKTGETIASPVLDRSLCHEKVFLKHRKHGKTAEFINYCHSRAATGKSLVQFVQIAVM